MPEPDRWGGCSIGCAGLFVLAGIIWPLLHLLGGTYEPEILFIPFVIGGPSFIVAHLFALTAIIRVPESGKARQALKIIWWSLAAAVAIVVVAAVLDAFTRRSAEAGRVIDHRSQ